MDISSVINNPNYIKLPLVGNKYCEKKPSSKDKDVIIVKDVTNQYDPNALKVISIRNSKEYHLGYVIKDKVSEIYKILDRLRFVTIVQKSAPENSLYYYLILEIV